ncbi:MAG TPA: hypothetical protein VKA89_12730 [Solirubrobacterales bacterium]|nr:hypothetical protein [Solirubrobacterales bacterium]
MKAVKTLVAAVLGSALLATAAPASADAAAFRHYVACGFTAQAKPSHSCHKRQKKAAFFRSKRADVTYKVCVRFPRGARPRSACVSDNFAEQGSLYYNPIQSRVPGRHKVTWFVGRKRVGVWYFRIRG